jgi:hypothetical protein
MKRFLLSLLILLTLPTLSAAQASAQRGTIVRMRMADCLSTGHRFMTAMAGAPQRQGDELCREYTLVTEKVVYVIVGRTSGQIIPLAETSEFRLHKNELLIRVDDATHETRFMIREMALRPDWERERLRLEDEAGMPNRPRLPQPTSIEVAR